MNICIKNYILVFLNCFMQRLIIILCLFTHQSKKLWYNLFFICTCPRIECNHSIISIHLLLHTLEKRSFTTTPISRYTNRKRFFLQTIPWHKRQQITYIIIPSCLSKFAIYTIHTIPLPVIYIRDIRIFCFEPFSCYCYYINN